MVPSCPYSSYIIPSCSLPHTTCPLSHLTKSAPYSIPYALCPLFHTRCPPVPILHTLYSPILYLAPSSFLSSLFIPSNPLSLMSPHDTSCQVPYCPPTSHLLSSCLHSSHPVPFCSLPLTWCPFVPPHILCHPVSFLSPCSFLSPSFNEVRSCSLSANSVWSTTSHWVCSSPNSNLVPSCPLPQPGPLCFLLTQIPSYPSSYQVSLVPFCKPGPFSSLSASPNL